MRVAPLVHRESGVMVVIRRFDVFTTEIWSIKVSHYNTKAMLGKQYSTLVATDTTCGHKPQSHNFTHKHTNTHTHTHTHKR